MGVPIDDRDAELARLRATVAELLGVVADLRRQVEAQQAHIHKLVKLTFGPRGERVAGPTLFDDTDPPTDRVPAVPPVDPAEPSVARRGHGRRATPVDLPRERVEVDLSDAEKRCPCCAAVRVRVGQEVSERLDYHPVAVFVREVIRPTYVCRACERSARDPQFAHAALPPRWSPGAGSGRGCWPRRWWPSSSTTCRSTARRPYSPGTGGRSPARPCTTTCGRAAGCSARSTN